MLFSSAALKMQPEWAQVGQTGLLLIKYLGRVWLMQYGAYPPPISYLIMSIGLDSGKHLDEHISQFLFKTAYKYMLYFS